MINTEKFKLKKDRTKLNLKPKKQIKIDLARNERVTKCENRGHSSWGASSKRWSVP